MRVSPFPYMLALSASLAAIPAIATDYSSLTEPGVARIQLLSGERVLQVECAGLAMHLAQTRPGSDKAAATRLNDAVSRRLGAELGDPEGGRSYLAGKARNYASPVYDPGTIRDMIAIMEPKCRSLIAEAGKGGRTLEDALGPVPTAPLELPGPEKCLPLLIYGVERNAEVLEGAADVVTTLRNDRLADAGPGEAARQAAIITDGVNVLRQQAPDDDRLNGMIYACFPAIHEAAKRAQDGGIQQH